MLQPGTNQVVYLVPQPGQFSQPGQPGQFSQPGLPGQPGQPPIQPAIQAATQPALQPGQPLVSPTGVTYPVYTSTQQENAAARSQPQQLSLGKVADTAVKVAKATEKFANATDKISSFF